MIYYINDTPSVVAPFGCSPHSGRVIVGLFFLIVAACFWSSELAAESVSVTDGPGSVYGATSGFAIDFDASTTVTAAWSPALQTRATYAVNSVTVFDGGEDDNINYFLGVYSFLDESTNPATLGGFLGVSDNTVNFNNLVTDAAATWTFTGIDVISGSQPGGGSGQLYFVYQTGTSALPQLPTTSNVATRRLEGTSQAYSDRLAAILDGGRGGPDLVDQRVPEYEAALTFLAPPPPPPAGSENSEPADLREFPWSLTARPWQPMDTPREDILDKVEDIVIALEPLQYWNPSAPGDVADGGDVQNGAIIDPYRNREWQYGTPYFSFAAATVVAAGRSPHLLEAAARALDHSTADITGLDGNTRSNDDHGEFFGAPMAKALRLFKQIAPDYPAILTPARIARWEQRLTVSRAAYMRGNTNNWRTYGMKGEWLRVQDGLVPYDSAADQGVPWIEGSWLGGQRARFVRDREVFGLDPYFHIYHDRDSGDRQNFAYLAGATGNLLDMIYNGYDGPSAADMEEILRFGAQSCLLQMAGNGESPGGGRTGNHIWNDIVYGNLFEMSAELAWQDGDERLAGQFRRAARMAFDSAWRFQTEQGWFSVTKSLIHPSHNNRYAFWSALTNYNGYTEIHSAEAYATRLTDIPEQPAPSEVGGYVAVLDPSFATTFVNAGGMQMQICTEGSTSGTSTGSQRWFSLGVQRFSRPGWDSRLGPADGWISNDGSEAISFSPAFREGGEWKLVAEDPDRFRGRFFTEFVHPLLIRGTLIIEPASGWSGPVFNLKMIVTPDGVLIDTIHTTGANEFGIIWPVLEYDGKHVLKTEVSSHIASTAFPPMSSPRDDVQAESASLVGGVTLSTADPDFNGSASALFPSSGGALEWNGINGGDGGAATIGFRYLLPLSQASSRALNLEVNGVSRTVTFEHTGSALNYGGGVLSFPMVWQQIHIPVTLAAGANNSIRLSASSSAGGLSIDELRVFPASANAPEPDQQNFISLDDAASINTTLELRRTGYGDQRPLLVTNAGGSASVSTFVYPRAAGDPTAELVRTSYSRVGDDFASALGRVEGTRYVGRTSAGGFGDSLDLDGDGVTDLRFNDGCGFIVQLDQGQVTAVEVDRFVTLTHQGRQLSLAPFTPIPWNAFEPMWNHQAIEADGALVEFAYEFTPSGNGTDEWIGLSRSGGTSTDDLIAGLHFRPDGLLTPLDAGALGQPGYQAGVPHRIRILFDGNRRVYHLWVKADGSPEQRLLANAPLPAGVVSAADLTALRFLAEPSALAQLTVEAIMPSTSIGLNINFQSADSPGFPGYEADTGGAFGARGNGWTYGWLDGDNGDLARNRNSSFSLDERYDTLIHLSFQDQPPQRLTWELELPNGLYTVRLVCGDPSYTNSFYQVLVEDEILVEGDAATTGQNFFENTATVGVFDGRLTISNGPDAVQNKIAFLEITDVPQTPFQSYEEFATRNFAGGINHPEAGPLDNPDHDWLNNLYEYAQGTNPRVNEVMKPALFGFAEGTTGQNVKLRFYRSGKALNAAFRIESSSDLTVSEQWATIWSSLQDSDFSSSLIQSAPAEGEDGWIVLELPLAPGENTVFYRLVIDLL